MSPEIRAHGGGSQWSFIEAARLTHPLAIQEATWTTLLTQLASFIDVDNLLDEEATHDPLLNIQAPRKVKAKGVASRILESAKGSYSYIDSGYRTRLCDGASASLSKNPKVYAPSGFEYAEAY